MAQLLLGSGYPYEVVIWDPKKGSAFSKFIPEEAGIILKKQLQNADTRYIDLGGALYFWSDVRKCERVEVPDWLDILIFKTIQDTSERMSILKEMARRAAIGTVFHNKEDVASFLNRLDESKKK